MIDVCRDFHRSRDRKIIEHKKGEVAERKELFPIKRLEQSIYFESQPVSMREYLLRPDMQGIIAEVKGKVLDLQLQFSNQPLK